MPHFLTEAEDSELALEVVLNTESGQVIKKDNAADLMLVYSECTKESTLEEAYERFRQQLSLRWGREVNKTMAYLVIESIVELTENAKKKHISVGNSES
jgi:hypothetical protein